jgi:formate-dependent nitrite reductase membrane component NrfD
MSWGVTLWIDLWCVGIASGAFIAAFLIDKLSGGKERNLFRLAVFTSVVFAFVAIIFLLAHLGHLVWFWHIFVAFRPLSVLSMGAWTLSLWLTVAGIMVALWLAEKFLKWSPAFVQKTTGALSWVGFALSILLISYGGVLIATTNQPLWASTLLFPAVFIGSALATGIGWLVLASLIMNKVTGWRVDTAVIARMAKALLVVLVLEIVLVAGFVLWLKSAASGAFDLLVTGELSLYFWLGLVGIGLGLPLLLLLYNGHKGVATRMAIGVVATSAVLAVAGGFILRAVLLVGGQL